MPSLSTSHMIPRVAQLHDARFTMENYNRDLSLMERVDRAPCITCAQLRAVAKQQGWTEEHLVKLCHGNIDEPIRTVKRILETNPPDTVIPYTCLIDLYHSVTHPPQARAGEGSCECGCGGEVIGKQRFSTSACRQRVHHHRQHPTARNRRKRPLNPALVLKTSMS
jgi:hypothetical protein